MTNIGIECGPQLRPRTRPSTTIALPLCNFNWILATGSNAKVFKTWPHPSTAHPGRFCHGLFGQFAQYVEVFIHDLTRHCHLGLEFGVGGSDQNARLGEHRWVDDGADLCRACATPASLTPQGAGTDRLG